MLINIVVEKNKDGLWAYAENVKSVVGHGENLEEIKRSIIDCIETLRQTNSCAKELKEKYKLIFKIT